MFVQHLSMIRNPLAEPFRATLRAQALGLPREALALQRDLKKMGIV